jgi:hypothetical protein
MNLIFSTLKKVLFWSYERGSWQYDVMCAAILAFIFASPNGTFQTRTASGDVSAFEQIFVPREAISEPRGALVEREIAEHLSGERGYEVEVSRIKPVMDESGNLVGYLAWGK